MNTGCNGAPTRNREQAGRGIDPEDDLDLPAIQRKVQTRADPDLEHSPTGSGNYLATILFELTLPHDQIEDWRQNPAVIEVHDGPFARHRPAAREMTLRDTSAPSAAPFSKSPSIRPI